MSIGFDQNNLDSATNTVMALAQKKGQKTILLTSENDTGNDDRKYQLDDPKDAKEYLMRYAERTYANLGKVVPGQVTEMPYFSIGVVFEQHPTEMYPPAVCRTSERPAYLAMFWQVL